MAGQTGEQPEMLNEAGTKGTKDPSELNKTDSCTPQAAEGEGVGEGVTEGSFPIGQPDTTSFHTATESRHNATRSNAGPNSKR